MKITLKEFFCIKENEDDEDFGRNVGANPFEPRKPLMPKSQATNPGLAQKKQSEIPPGTPIKQASNMPPGWKAKARAASKAAGEPSRTLAKPNYPGSFFGQSWTTNDKVVSKPVSWMDRLTQQNKYGKVDSMQKATMVWDGDDKSGEWISAADFNKKYGDAPAPAMKPREKMYAPKDKPTPPIPTGKGLVGKK